MAMDRSAGAFGLFDGWVRNGQVMAAVYSRSPALAQAVGVGPGPETGPPSAGFANINSGAGAGGEHQSQGWHHSKHPCRSLAQSGRELRQSTVVPGPGPDWRPGAELVHQPGHQGC